MKDNPRNNTFLLIDGNAILYRAYHALPPLSKNGVVVNAVYGFFSMLFKVIDEVQPEYIAVCFDRPKPTFRQQMYVGYHANRPKMADDLIPQVVMVHELLAKMHISVFEVDGYEADDLIGTIAYQTQNGKLKAQNLETIILSGDRDILQLVTAQVKVLMPITGITNMSLYDEAKVEEKFGITPSQVIDFKALVGDASDNYPGVSGIGPKTARDLLVQYKTFENLYEHINELPEKISQKLAHDAEQAALCKKLATIVIDAPIQLDLTQCAITHMDADEITAMFEELAFKSLQKRIPKQIILQSEKKKKEKDGQQLGLL